MIVVANSTMHMSSSLLAHLNGCFVVSIQSFEADDTSLVTMRLQCDACVARTLLQCDRKSDCSMQSSVVSVSSIKHS